MKNPTKDVKTITTKSFLSEKDLVLASKRLVRGGSHLSNKSDSPWLEREEMVPFRRWPILSFRVVRSKK
jgi:hypothetical protein